MTKILAILLVAVTLLVGCSRVAEAPTPMNPEAIAKTFFEASDSGDIERCLSLLSYDVVFSQDPPGVKVQGAQYEAALRENAKWHRKHSVTIPYKVDGNKVTFKANVSGDDFRILGVDSINISYELQVRDEKITSIVATPDSADWARLAELSSGRIGVSLTFTDKGARVEKVVENSPAYEAGVKTGDIIIAVDRVKYSQMRAGEIQLRISGKAGSEVLLTVIREGVTAPIDIEVTRAAVQ